MEFPRSLKLKEKGSKRKNERDSIKVIQNEKIKVTDIIKSYHFLNNTSRNYQSDQRGSNAGYQLPTVGGQSK